MKSNTLKYFRIPYGEPEWYKFRTTGIDKKDGEKIGCDPYEGGIGASEIGSVLGLSKYRPVPAELRAWKTGMSEPKKEDNEAMFWGRMLEVNIREAWQHYDGTETGYIERYTKWLKLPGKDRRKNVVRAARRVNSYIVNTKYPWLFCSLDFHAESGSANLITGQEEPHGFPVETKTISGFASRQWEHEIPPAYVAQAQMQMLITESDYSELVVLKDGRYMNVWPIEKHQPTWDRILNESKEFWDNVLETRKLIEEQKKADLTGSEKLSGEIQHKIDALEPEPDDNPAWQQYLAEGFINEVEKIYGSNQQYDLCLKNKFAQEIIKKLEDEKQYCVNNLVADMKKHGAEEIDFDDLGKFTWKKPKGKKTPVPRNLIKVVIDEDRVEKEFNKLNLKY